jgi:hypothetical protein
LTRRTLEKLKSIALGEWKAEDDAPQTPEAESTPEETAASPEVSAEASRSVKEEASEPKAE